MQAQPDLEELFSQLGIINKEQIFQFFLVFVIVSIITFLIARKLSCWLFGIDEIIAVTQAAVQKTKDTNAKLEVLHRTLLRTNKLLNLQSKKDR